ncbi:MAG: FAD-dependent oxidoreductase [Acidimicrobiales bacterium]|nr:FAD-dependent oxidoreductase [Acidimicrobiales bacterium]
MTSHDVVVVGAGLAGLAASIRLRDKGHEPLVLERSDGPGGRVRTDMVDGFRLDRGFQLLLTAYPAAQDLLDYDALDLEPFDAGALVRIDDAFHRVADPFRSPGDAFGTLRAPIGTLKDKRAILRFRKRVQAGEVDDLFTQKETTALDRLREVGFSDRMIDRFLRPLFSGIALDDALGFSSRSLEFVFRMLSDGDAAVPRAGMGAISDQLASRLPAGSIRYDTTVTGVGDRHVEIGDRRLEADAVVVATDAADAARLTDGEVDDPGANALTTWWFAAPEPPLRRPLIVLDGNGDSAVNNLAVLSQVSPDYAPDDRALVAVSSPRLGVDESAVRTTLTDWYGGGVEGWETLRVDAIERAQPKQLVGEDPDQRVRLNSGLFVAGDHRQHASINGALVSGCRAADAVAAKLCRAD